MTELYAKCQGSARALLDNWNSNDGDMDYATVKKKFLRKFASLDDPIDLRRRLEGFSREKGESVTEAAIRIHSLGTALARVSKLGEDERNLVMVTALKAILPQDKRSFITSKDFDSAWDQLNEFVSDNPQLKLSDRDVQQELIRRAAQRMPEAIQAMKCPMYIPKADASP